MNKFVNTLLFFLSFIALIIVVIVGRDLPLDFLHTTGENMPYKEYIFLGLATLILLLGGRRSAQRWMGVALIRKTKKYEWNVEMDKGRTSRTIFYLVMEASYHIIMAYIYYFIASMDAIAVIAVMLILAFDHLIFALLGKFAGIYRIGITKAAVVTVDREVKVLYYSGLRKISIHQDSIYFNYIEDLVLDFPANTIPETKRQEFSDVLKKQIDLKKVYLDESFKNFK